MPLKPPLAVLKFTLYLDFDVTVRCEQIQNILIVIFWENYKCNLLLIEILKFFGTYMFIWNLSILSLNPPFFLINGLTINLASSHVTAFLLFSQKQSPEIICAVQKGVLKTFANLQENTSVGVSFLTENLQLFWKRDSNTGFSCEYCEISKSTYFEEHPQTDGSIPYLGPLVFQS